MNISVLNTPYVDLDDLIEEHGEDKAQVLFEQFRNTPPDGEPDKEFAQSIVDRLPKGMAVLAKVEWMLENPESESDLHWCQLYHFDFPTIKSWDSVVVEAETKEEAETKAFEAFDIIKSARFVDGAITYIGEVKNET